MRRDWTEVARSLNYRSRCSQGPHKRYRRSAKNSSLLLTELLSPGQIELSPGLQIGVAPVYSAPLPPPGGGLDADDPWYIRRSTDITAKSLISHQGVTLVIKGSRQMGKTSLLVRTLSTAIDLGKRCALIDFQMLGQESLSNSSTFFCRFARSVAEGLEIEQNATDTWDGSLSDSQNLTRYMERGILQIIDAPRPFLYLSAKPAAICTNLFDSGRLATALNRVGVKLWSLGHSSFLLSAKCS